MIIDIIKKRRSVFPAQYNTKPLQTTDIKTVLEAANWAPTHKKTQPWRFKVLQDENLERLGIFLAEKYKEINTSFSEFKYKKIQEKPQKAAAVIAICMQRDPKERLPEWEEIAATAMAVQNMWLTATDLGIGAYWSSPALIKYMDEFFNLMEGERCLGFFYMGNFDEEPAKVKREPIDLKVEWL